MSIVHDFYMSHIVNLSQLADLSRFSSEFSRLDNDYVFSHIDLKAGNGDFTSSPVKIDGMCWTLCFDGAVELNVNLESITVGRNMLLLTNPDSILEIKKITGEHLESYTLFISREFMHDINFDINILSTIPRRSGLNRTLYFELTDDETSLFRNYFHLLHHNTIRNSDDLFVRSIARCIIAALFYQAILVARSHHDADGRTDESANKGHRRSSYVDDFISLLHIHHRRERSVSFYASKLFISPKYLSLVIKKATGKSAAELIDDFVILEAKNLLRYSGKNIQQVAYELNFPNQSSFGKYFKHLTGMSPSRYQRT